jgi:fructose-1,6-bisphosphatase/inositol monophosphatase family enzyme
MGAGIGKGERETGEEVEIEISSSARKDKPASMNPLVSPWTSVAVEAASAAALRLIELDRSSERGGQFVNDHADASIQADLETEAAILRVLEERGVRGVFLSEEYLKEGQRPEIQAKGSAELDGGRRVYVVADPLDGSAIYAHGLPLWWYSCVGIYGEDGEALGSCIVDVPRRVIYACDAERSYRSAIDDRVTPVNWTLLKAPPEKPMSESWLAVYTIKPKYLALTVDRYRPLVSAFWATIPNGGPGGFTDCADGLADVYFHYGLPDTEHLSGGLMIGERAGCIITDREGRRPVFSPEMGGEPTLICANSPGLHERTLELLQDCER